MKPCKPPSDRVDSHHRSKTVIRYAITHVSYHTVDTGIRVLTFSNNAYNHYRTRAEASRMLQAVIKHNSPETITKMYNDSLEVRPVECFENGDAVGIYFVKCGGECGLEGAHGVNCSLSVPNIVQRNSIIPKP